MTTNDNITPNRRVEAKTIKMSYDNFESAIISFLYSMGSIPPNWDVIYTDFGVPLNDEGLVEFTIEIAKPVRPQLRVVDENYQGAKEEQQMVLPLEVFETIHVE